MEKYFTLAINASQSKFFLKALERAEMCHSKKDPRNLK